MGSEEIGAHVRQGILIFLPKSHTNFLNKIIWIFYLLLIKLELFSDFRYLEMIQ